MFCEHLQISFLLFRREKVSGRCCSANGASVDVRGLSLAGTAFGYRPFFLRNLSLAAGFSYMHIYVRSIFFCDLGVAQRYCICECNLRGRLTLLSLLLGLEPFTRISFATCQIASYTKKTKRSLRQKSSRPKKKNGQANKNTGS